MTKIIIDVKTENETKTTANEFPNWRKAARSNTNVGSIDCWNKTKCMVIRY